MNWITLAAKTAEQIEQTKLAFLGLGFIIIWAGIAVYLMTIAKRQRSLERRLAEAIARGPHEPSKPPADPDL